MKTKLTLEIDLETWDAKRARDVLLHAADEIECLSEDETGTITLLDAGGEIVGEMKFMEAE